jgi:hypothetical protein
LIFFEPANIRVKASFLTSWTFLNPMNFFWPSWFFWTWTIF